MDFTSHWRVLVPSVGRLRWAGLVARLEVFRNARKIVAETEGKDFLKAVGVNSRKML